jgi:POT family proton-dependent oligopeptide transporter
MTSERFLAGDAGPGFARAALLRLSAIEFWERYSYYNMFGLLALFFAAPLAVGGMGWTKGDALRFFGWYLLVVSCTPMVGGFLIGRVISTTRALGGGATLMVAGHSLMAAPAVIPWAFQALGLCSIAAVRAAPLGGLVAPPGMPPNANLAYHLVTLSLYAAIALIAVGNGLFKPVITVVIGRLPHADVVERDRAFTLFFLFINIGGLAALIVGGWLSEHLGWGWAFGAAGLGMAIARVLMMVFAKRYLEPFAERDRARDRLEGAEPPRSVWLPPIAALIVLLIVQIMFSFQSYGFVGLFTSTMVDRRVAGFTIPTPWFGVLNPVVIMVLTPFVIAATARGFFGRRSPTVRRLAGCFATMALAFAILAAIVPPAGLRAPPFGVLAAIALLAFSELLMAPVISSSLTRLAPDSLQAAVVGTSAAAGGIGAWLSGQMGAAAISGDLVAALGVFAVACAVVGVGIAACTPLFRRWNM